MELFETIRREYEFGVGTIQGVARTLGVHRRLVREALGSAVPAARKPPRRARPTLAPLTAFIDAVLQADRKAPRKQQNADTTDTQGRFGWDVLAGFYKVVATKTGCTATATSTTGVLTIPPPVTGLVLTLNCPGGDVNGDGSVTPLDAQCVLRSIAALAATPNCPTVPTTAPSSGDVNNDGFVTPLDAQCVLRSIALLAGTPGCPKPLP
ncbi:MAG: dockerin type I domain-containing protein [Dehalococcoidia bacterium]